MREDVREAIESARTAGSKKPSDFDVLRVKLFEVIRNLPEDMSVAELRDELEPY